MEYVGHHCMSEEAFGRLGSFLDPKNIKSNKAFQCLSTFFPKDIVPLILSYVMRADIVTPKHVIFTHTMVPLHRSIHLRIYLLQKIDENGHIYVLKTEYIAHDIEPRPGAANWRRTLKDKEWIKSSPIKMSVEPHDVYQFDNKIPL